MSRKRVILITGASSGIGAAAARLFGQHGYLVALTARREAELEAIAGQIRARGGSALAIPADITRLADIQTVVRTAQADAGPISLLFNNAGTLYTDWIEALKPEEIEAQLQVNTLGAIWTAQAVLPEMIRRGSGHIINMISLAALLPMPTYSGYAASKAGLHGFTEALRREVQGRGVMVSALYPGGTRTSFATQPGRKRVATNATPSFLTLEAHDVAVAALRLARKPRRRMIIPWPYHVAVWVNAISPGLVDWMIERFFVRRRLADSDRPADN